MKRDTRHMHAPSRRRVGTDETRRSTRRKLIVAALAWPAFTFPAFSLAQQQTTRIPRIGVLISGGEDTRSLRLEAFRQGLHDLGYIEGKNIVLELRFAAGRQGQLTELADDLVRSKVDILVASDGDAIRAARRATPTIPIVMAQSVDPVETGFVASLAKPGGNVTGLSYVAPQAGSKGLQMLKEIFPKIRRVYLLSPSPPGDISVDVFVREVEETARRLGLTLQTLRLSNAGELDDAFLAMKKAHADALVVRPNPLLSQNRKRIVDLAAKHRIPAVYANREWVDGGGLMSYGANRLDLWRRAAVFVDKLLKGAKPEQLPVEQATKFELVINAKAAKALGVEIPQAVLMQATMVNK